MNTFDENGCIPFLSGHLTFINLDIYTSDAIRSPQCLSGKSRWAPFTVDEIVLKNFKGGFIYSRLDLTFTDTRLNRQLFVLSCVQIRCLAESARAETFIKNIRKYAPMVSKGIQVLFVVKFVEVE